ncbi:complement C1q subcomponent subunit C-like isoform X1 [Brachyistius frenatus]|uniref:complement C1q subcomponent subunit C-like isoform X1 n=1 Tax=Brachyistius frenatus TaxID=100188 RepID=UPI0037E8B939
MGSTVWLLFFHLFGITKQPARHNLPCFLFNERCVDTSNQKSVLLTGGTKLRPFHPETQLLFFGTMGGYYGLVVLVSVASLMWTGHCNGCCKGTDGHAGEPGHKGRDGWPGVKGEKGQPAVMADGPVDAGVLLTLKGEMGNRGSQGVMGPKGYRGDLGRMGHPGKPGQPGPAGRSIGPGQLFSQQEVHSAFSVMRNVTSYPRYSQIIKYQQTLVNKPNPGDFNAAAGLFTCRVPGVYYFNFHSMAKVSICLQIASDALSEKLAFCDYNRNRNQVLSGGVVLQLAVGQKVWLESFKDEQTAADTQDNQEKHIIFNGFLVFSNPE